MKRTGTNTNSLQCKIFFLRKRGGGDGELVREGVGILEGDGGAGFKGAAAVEEAVVVGEALESLGIDESDGGEPAAVEMDSGNGTPGDARVHDGGTVEWDAVRHGA